MPDITTDFANEGIRQADRIIDEVAKLMDREKVINDLNTARLILFNPKMLTPEMCIKIGQAITSALPLLKEQEAVVRCKDCQEGAYVTAPGMLPFVKCGGVDHELDWFCADGKRR